MKNKGSILVLTLCFIFVFNLLGIASIYHATLQNENAGKKLKSMKAFWLADAGVQRAKKRLKEATPYIIEEMNPSNPSEENPERLVSLGEGSSDVYSWPDSYFPNRWHILSKGTVDNQIRRIEATAANNEIDKALTTKGPIFDPPDKGCPWGSVDVYSDPPILPIPPPCDHWVEEEVVDLSLETVLNGTTQQDLYDAASWIYTDAEEPDPIEGVTIINVTESYGPNQVVLNTNHMTESAFVYIDMSGVTDPPSVRINGDSAFSGIIWIVGETTINGDVDINGAVFVESSETTKVLGNADFVFDPVAIAEALGEIGNPSLGIPSLIAWREI